VEIPADLRVALEDAANEGLGAFREAWKGLSKESRGIAQSDSKWFEGLRAKAESVKPGA
jgi:hypothetical protein